MMNIVTAAEMRQIDRRTTEEFGVPSLTLMENAGSAVAEFCLREYPNAKTVGIICGKGNNGGDGFVVARKLHEAGKTVRVLLLTNSADVKGDAAAMLKRLPVEPVIARNEEELNNDVAQQVFNGDLLVDAILGTGFNPPLSLLYSAAIRRLIGEFDEAGAQLSRTGPVVSIDIASGMESDVIDGAPTNSKADAVVTFTAFKPAQVFADFSPRTVLAQIGSPAAALSSSLNLAVMTAGGAAHPFIGRDVDAHKGEFGHVLIIGGSVGKSGAAAMAGLAALRTGAGLVTVACPRSVLPMIASVAPELMTQPLEETDSGTISIGALEVLAREVLKGKTAVALGPGISRHPETEEFTRKFVEQCSLPLVLDADGLNAFENHVELLSGSTRSLVLTPHPGEFARLSKIAIANLHSNSARLEGARALARRCNCVVVLKGHRTLTSEPDGYVWVNTTGNAGMATGGMGDVLTGMVAALMARPKMSYASLASTDRVASVKAVRDAATAVFLHGFAGDIAAERFGQEAMVATDLIHALPTVFSRIHNSVYHQHEIQNSWYFLASEAERKRYLERWGPPKVQW